ncbi:MAG: carboxylating nicotinate-nucleotide diphosphorylase [Candidatus Omnitrophica bacterium]|nr:carboxylating nicotinate-nucleotide diphosphorylase [Candidatus Omnitrophota bacterium]
MLEKDKIIDIIKNALKEDIGRMDITTTFLIPSNLKVKADIVSKSSGVLAGLPLIEMAYGFLDTELRIRFNAKDGDLIEPGKAVCYLEGPAASILKGERVVLNLLGRSSGVATITKKFVDRVKKYNADIMDTRKTTPNMRHIDRYAVVVGGGKNHRFGLFDQVLIKDNHLAALKELRPNAKATLIIKDAIETAKKRVQKNVKVEIEVRNIAEFEEALSAGADIIMLDNMPPEGIKEAVKIRNAGGVRARQVKIEASGGITLDNVEEYAKTGVDRISIGALTHSASSLDFSLDVI